MKLHTIGKQYFEFLTEFSNPAVQDVPASFPTLFSPRCRKIVNAKLLCQDVDEVYMQLLEAKSDFGNHTITNSKILTDHEKKTCVLYFLLKTPATSYVVTTLLLVDETGLITEINDVYNEIGANN